MKGATTLENPAVVPYYRDDSCLDDGTGDNPGAAPLARRGRQRLARAAGLLRGRRQAR